MSIWLILGIGAGAVGGVFVFSKILPGIIRAIQYRRRIKNEEYKKNLAYVNKLSKKYQAKIAKRKERKEARKIERKQNNERRKALTKAILKKSARGLAIAIVVPVGFGVYTIAKTGQLGFRGAKAITKAGIKGAKGIKNETVHGISALRENGLRTALKSNASYMKDATIEKTTGLAYAASNKAHDLAEKAGNIKDAALKATGEALIAGIDKVEPVITKGAGIVGTVAGGVATAGIATAHGVATAGKAVGKGASVVAKGTATAVTATAHGVATAGKATAKGVGTAGRVLVKGTEKTIEGAVIAGGAIKNAAVYTGETIGKGAGKVAHGVASATKTVKDKTVETGKNIANAGIEKTVGIAAAGIAAGAAVAYDIAEKRNAIAEKEELADSLKSRAYLSKKDKEKLIKAEQDLIQHQIYQRTLEAEAAEKEAMRLASPNPEYDLTQIEQKVDAISALEQKSKLTRAEAKQLKKLKKEAESFLRKNQDYERALINKKVQGKDSKKSQLRNREKQQKDNTKQKSHEK